MFPPPSGSGGVSGSIASNQVAVGTGTDTIGGDAGFTFNSTTKAVSLIRGINSTLTTDTGIAPSLSLAGQTGDSNSNVLLEFAGGGQILAFASSGGTIAAPTVSADGSLLGYIGFTGYDGTNWGDSGGIEMRVSGTAVSGNYAVPTKMNFGTSTDSSGFSVKMTLLSGGGLLIAATSNNAIQTGDTGDIVLGALKTTGAATGKKVVCVDTTTGKLYASSAGNSCAN